MTLRTGWTEECSSANWRNRSRTTVLRKWRRNAFSSNADKCKNAKQMQNTWWKQVRESAPGATGFGTGSKRCPSLSIPRHTPKESKLRNDRLSAKDIFNYFRFFCHGCRRIKTKWSPIQWYREYYMVCSVSVAGGSIQYLLFCCFQKSPNKDP